MRIEELHDRLYDHLLLIDNICEENNLRYFVAYGTAIGSLREKDFIPWDDDMDIMVLAEDYDHFKNVMIKWFPSHLHFIEPQDYKPYFYDYTVRIIDDRFLIRKETDSDRAYKNYQNHIGVDVFVAAGCPYSFTRRKLFVFLNKVLHGMPIQFRYRQDYSKYTTLQKILVSILRMMGRLYSRNNPGRIINMWYRQMHKYDANKTGWRFVLNAPLTAHYQKEMPNEWFLGRAVGYIRDKEVPLIGGYDNFLKLIYGDYMIPEKNTKKYFTHLDEVDKTIGK